MILDKFLVRQQIFLHRLAAFVDLLDRLYFLDQLFVLRLHQPHFFVVVLDHGIFVAQFLLHESHRWLHLGHLLTEHFEFFFHHCEAALSRIQLLLHLALHDFQVLAIIAYLVLDLYRLLSILVVVTAATRVTLLG